MDNFESTFLRWICLFDEFKDNEYSNIKNLVSSTSFKQFVDNVFCLKCSSALSTEDTQVYNTIKVNYSEFEVQKHEDLYNEENSIYTCVVVLLHALLKCTNDKFRNQLSERMNNEEQELLANFLKAAQSLLFTKQNISEALMLISDSKHTSINTSEIYSNNNTPIKSKSMRRSYLQEFCESPKSQCLINQEKEKYITKLTEDYKNECEENYKLAENVKYLKDLNIKLNNKLEDKDKILQLLKDEIKEYSKPNQSPENKIDNTLIIKKLNRDKLDLEMNCNELKQQITELDKKHTELNGKFEKKTSDYNDLILMFDNIESENITLKRNLKLYEETIQAKDTEITSLKDELCNKSITNNPSNISGQEANAVPSNTLFNELSCLKLEEITHDKEKYRHKYKSIKRELSNSEIQVKELNEKIIVLEKKLNDYETHKDELIDQFSNKIKELQECQKKKNNLESKIKHLKDNIKDNENHIESLCSKLNKRDKQIEMLSVEIDSVKKSKTMIELILSKTNTEIEAIHEEHDEKVKNLQSIIEEYKNSEKLSHQSYIDLENNMKNVQDNLANKEHLIIYYEEKMAENYQTIGAQEEQLNTMYQEKLLLETHLKNIRIEIETQQKHFSDKNHEMENCLEYYLEELKDVKNEKTKIEEILQCKKNEIEQQLELINYQKDIIKTLQSEKCSQQLIINDLNEVVQQKSSENKDLSAKVLESTLDLNKLNEQLKVALADNNTIETNLKKNELQMKTLKEEFQCQINDMKNVLENQSNQCIIKVEQLQETIEKKQNDFNDQLIICNKLTETISQLQVEKFELEEKLKSSGQDLNKKQIQFEQATEENNKLKQTVDYTEKQCLDLQHKLNGLKNIILKKEEDIKLLEVDVSEYSVSKESLQNQVIETQQVLNNKIIELENQIQQNNEQRETIVKLNDEKECLGNKIKNLEDSLSHNEYKFNLCEGKLYDCSNTIDNLEKKINEMKNEKSCLEVELNETITKLSNVNQDLILQLETNEKIILETQEKLILEQNELKKQIEKSNEQIKTISILNAERDSLKEETNTLQESLNKNDDSLKSLQEKVLICEKQYEDLQELKTNLISELSENQLKLLNLQDESKQQLKDMNIKYNEVHEKCNNKQIELDEYITKYNCLVETNTNLTTKIDNLINKTDALESKLLNKDSVITANQEKLLEYEEMNKKIITEKTLMEVDLTQRLEKMGEIGTKLADLQEELNFVHMRLETQEKENDQHLKTIFTLTSDKDNLINETKTLKDCLLEKEKSLTLNETKLIGFETQLNELQSQKNNLESELSDTKVQLDNIQHDLTQKLEVADKKLQEVEEQRINLQEELKEQNKCSIEQIEKINSLICEKNNLVNETNKLQEHLAQNKIDLELNQNKLQDYVKQNKEIESQNTLLLTELHQLKCQMDKLRQESTEEIDKINKKNLEAQEEISNKESEINKQIKLKNDSIIDIYQKINDLKNLKVELESILNKERKNFETYFETCLNYSSNHIQNKPIVGHHDSLIEVITSADTFIEQNGIQLAQVENCDEYSIIEKVKKIFEVLKMFIISLKSQGNEQTIDHISNESNEAYTELLAISKTQQATIKHLENEISTLKSECNHKMSKVQQKTQEYVTSEYEKKFERKREQMKQFCKDLEAKIHQDYETKLLKYKDKITKDEIHIKELGQQLWEVSEKYLKLQQKDRRESTVSLPFEMSMISETTTTLPKYNSFTLPKASSVGQIRSLVEETTRSYHDNTKRNVPAGIGKKFSLSSGKIFPKEEDEEGEMFNHSCLSDLKQGKVRLSDNKKQYNERLSELQARNSLCPPHLRSCYAVETNFLPNTSLVTEEDIKTIANYSDYETENLIPNDRNKKKDRNQTSYKKPGPPTPSKNGGRVSLSGNQKITLKESKETNTNKRRASSTPNKLFSLFMSKKN
ncbi:putative leucine-rich repeat-containing protein DDB_G0290503 isoform X1 [Aphis gossypii]|uniref:putative leucine-rich repeat-containing protein DDB_G0290503 isoform X1 n=1 Tax=Aphis gossypii TaxID=80765 RepID=UPI0021599AD4|nr:putative leucine-rich repeat-containing protein DDB_G0290503 isoform X1 [Aphis gossypii]